MTLFRCFVSKSSGSVGGGLLETHGVCSIKIIAVIKFEVNDGAVLRLKYGLIQRS